MLLRLIWLTGVLNPVNDLLNTYVLLLDLVPETCVISSIASISKYKVPHGKVDILKQ